MDLAPFSGCLIHTLLSREINIDDEDKDDSDIAFHVRGVDLRFGELEFGLISGLKCGDIKSMDDMVKNVKPIRKFRHKYFGYQDPIKNSDIQAAFTKPGRWEKGIDEDVVMMACLYFVSGCVLEDSRTRKIPEHIMDIAEFPALFNAYPWGTLAFIKLRKAMRIGIGKRLPGLVAHHQGKKEKKTASKKKASKPCSSYQIYGIPHVLQTWLLEVWDETHKFYEKRPDSPLPRVLRWKMKEPPARSPTILSSCNLFNDGSYSPPKNTKLEAEEEEKVCGWYQKVMDKFEGRECDIESLFAGLEVVGLEEEDHREDNQIKEMVMKEFAEIRNQLAGLGGRVSALEIEFQQMKTGGTAMHDGSDEQAKGVDDEDKGDHNGKERGDEEVEKGVGDGLGGVRQKEVTEEV